MLKIRKGASDKHKELVIKQIASCTHLIGVSLEDTITVSLHNTALAIEPLAMWTIAVVVTMGLGVVTRGVNALARGAFAAVLPGAASGACCWKGGKRIC